MSKLSLILKVLIFVAVLIITTFAVISFYPYIFAKTIEGEITAVERVTTPLALMTTTPGQLPSSQIFSFAVAVRDAKTGEIFTASSEDRQWAAVQKGFCAKTKFFPYPPWQLDKAGTYYNARLLRLYDCKNKPAEE